MPFAWFGSGPWRRGRGQRFAGTGFANAAEHEPASLYVDLLSAKSRSEPHLGHDIVTGVVAPPGGILRRIPRKLGADHAFDFGEGHRQFVGALGTEKFSKRGIFAHSRPRMVLQNKLY